MGVTGKRCSVVDSSNSLKKRWGAEVGSKCIKTLQPKTAERGEEKLAHHLVQRAEERRKVSPGCHFLAGGWRKKIGSFVCCMLLLFLLYVVCCMLLLRIRGLGGVVQRRKRSAYLSRELNKVSGAGSGASKFRGGTS